jgi:phosphoribosyl-ATP pyrophosphohydrolase/phosphoribosyl-AMP cyclohydrolase
MIIPSIDIMGGRVVQLVGGRDLALEAGDPAPLARRFGVVGEVAVIDLDAAIGQGSNADLVRGLLRIARCRVGGGIRSVDTALQWLDAGAARIILGSAARPDLLRHLPRDRVIVALDAEHGEVVVDGWRTRTGVTVVDAMGQLRDLAGGFLVTFVEREGRMGGVDVAAIEAIRRECGEASLTVAGGLASADEIAVLDQMGVDAQVGMALYTGRFSVSDAVASMLRSDRADGLWPTVVADERGVALGLCWSNLESLTQAIDRRRGVYWSRTRGLWEKGATSGATQELLAVDLDCDRDALRFTVRQKDGFCHRGTRTCWGRSSGQAALESRITDRLDSAPPGSYTVRLQADRDLLKAKLVEEATELAEASKRDEVIHEAADLMYFAQVATAAGGATLADVDAELDRRALRVSRRTGEAKAEVEARS